MFCPRACLLLLLGHNVWQLRRIVLDLGIMFACRNFYFDVSVLPRVNEQYLHSFYLWEITHFQSQNKMLTRLWRITVYHVITLKHV